MRFIVVGAHIDHYYGVEHIIKLFYEDPQIVFAARDESEIVEARHRSDVTITVNIEEEGNAVAATVVVANEDGTESRARVDRPNQAVKRALHIALLHALTEHTGVEQPWGTLIGVRPQKLVHQRLQKGESLTHIRAELTHEYLITPQKIAIMEGIAERQLEAIPDLYDLNREVSLYIGIPFCPTKCAYCTFPAYAIGSKQGAVDPFLRGLHEEIRAVGTWLQEHRIGVTTIYFGGGTPTSIEAEELDALFATMERYLPNGARSRELTVEAGRPDTITRAKLAVMKKWHVDRISINPQTFTERTLRAIGRHHTVEEIFAAYALARECGMDNINMDIIVGLPGEGMAEVMHTMQELKVLRPESITAHTLSYKSASAMTQNKAKYPVASSEEVSAMVGYTATWAKEQGYQPYYLYRQKNILGNQENVGYALPGKESMYNILIMEEIQTIVGIGCGAASKIIDPHTRKITRFANPKEPKAYIDQVDHYITRKLALLQQYYNEE